MKNTFIKRAEIDIINRISPVINFYDTVYFLKTLNSKRDLILHQTLADSTRGRRFSRGFVLIIVNRNKETRYKGNLSSVKSRTQYGDAANFCAEITAIPLISLLFTLFLATSLGMILNFAVSAKYSISSSKCPIPPCLKKIYWSCVSFFTFINKCFKERRNM